MALHPGDDFRQQLFEQLDSKAVFEQAKAHAFVYLDQKETMPVFPSAASVEALAGFDQSFPENFGNPQEILLNLHQMGSPATVVQTGGRYFGFVCGSATPVAMAAKWLADVWDQNPALFVMSPVVAKLEAICQEWLKELLGLPPETVAGFVSGSSTANLCGLAAGRNYLLKRQGWKVNEQGMAGAPKIRVILGEQAHATVFKALALLGLGTAGAERVPVDDQGRMDIDKLPPLDSCCLVIAQAGNVNSGSFDPLDALCGRARKAGAWVHVDVAFGLWAAGSRTRQFFFPKNWQPRDSGF